MAEIPDAYLLLFLGGVFIPTFVFCIKMIMEVNSMKGKHEGFKDLMELKLQAVVNEIERTCKDMEAIRKAVDMLNQFSYGRDSKSIPPFMTGMDETLEHRNMPDVGIFRDYDSAEKDRNNKRRNNDKR